MEKDWVVDDDMSERYPIFTRGNVGEVFPDPVAPFTWSLVGFSGSELGWRDAFARFGAIDHDELRPDGNEVLTCFGGYCYLNVSLSRLLGARTPGMTPEMIDYSLFGEQAGIPPYEPREGDEDPAKSARIEQTLGWIVSAEDVPDAREQQREIDDLREARPDLSSLSDTELLARARELMHTHFRPLFAQHLFNSYCAIVGAGIVSTVAAELGDPTMAMRLVAGIGDVESAAPSWAMWDLGRMAASSPTLTAAFDAGVEGLLDRLRADGGDDGTKFLAAFDDFIHAFGSRGPNEWEMRSPTWETHPVLALTAIDRMRVSPESSAPTMSNEDRVADREALTASISEQLAGNPEVQGQFLAGIRAASVFLAARERSKTTIVKLINECRVAMHELGRRLVAAGQIEQVEDFGLVLDQEFDDFLADAAAFREVIRERRARMEELASLEPPFILVGELVPTSSWERRGANQVEQLQAGQELSGIPGCPGVATGRARVILDQAEGGRLEPGDVLVTAITDPSWTPLFVPAAAVVVDVGAQVSHAVIVSRELGIPCVVSVTDGTRKIPDGAMVEVDGTNGTVRIVG